MTNPFEDEGHQYHVLVNAEGQYSLWPEMATIPSGWSSKFGPNDRKACLQFIEENWSDMRPTTLVAEEAATR